MQLCSIQPFSILDPTFHPAFQSTYPKFSISLGEVKSIDAEILVLKRVGPSRKYEHDDSFLSCKRIP